MILAIEGEYPSKIRKNLVAIFLTHNKNLPKNQEV
jgi:hypothetical protein